VRTHEIDVILIRHFSPSFDERRIVAADLIAKLMLMIVPLMFFRKCGRIARVTFITPKTFTSNCSRTFSSEIASNTPKPALLMSASIFPNRAMPAAIACSMLY